MKKVMALRFFSLTSLLFTDLFLLSDSKKSFTLKTSLRHPYQVQNGSQYPPFKGCFRTPPSMIFTLGKNILNRAVKIPTYTIDLHLPPEQRWRKLVVDKKEELVYLLESIKNNTDMLFGKSVFHLLNKYIPYLLETFPETYRGELEGIADATGITLSEVTLYNVFYEFFSMCTSVVVRARDGQMYLGRNLDFGLFLGWNQNSDTWLTTEHLKPLVVKLIFMRRSHILYESVNFAGYVGILTAVKAGKFGLTVDERFQVDGGYVGIVEWVLGSRHQRWMGLLTRVVMEEAEDYDSAIQMLTKPQLVAPVYFVVAGNETGCVVTRGRNSSELNHLGSHWFLVQTNYDHWVSPPFYDDRRTPAELCLRKLGRNKPLCTLHDVLSTRPVLNKLTTYMAIIDVGQGTIDAQLQYCEDPCWPW